MNKLGSGPDHALLAAKLAPRLELVALQQGQVATDAAAGPVVEVQKVANEVRLPSHIALERQLPAASPGTAPAPDAASPAAARLSSTARLIGALLAELPDAGPLRGAAPLWPASAQGVGASALASALAQVVDRSGLFYESHLAQFAAGARTLGQMAQEPQARWAPAAFARHEAGAAPAAAPAAAAPATEVESARPVALPASLPLAPTPASVGGTPAQAHEHAQARGAPAGHLPAAPRPAGGEAVTTVPPPLDSGTAPTADAQRMRAAYRAGEGGAPSAPDDAERHRMEIDGVRRLAASAATALAAPMPQAGEMIHPQAVTVVHQQLDLLATAVFRWNGQAWPEVPMDWSIHEEQAHPQGDDAQDPQPRRWSTTVSLDLPRLGPVELRLSLSGAAVQAQMVASRDATAARLRADGDALERRFEAAGLRLDALRVSETSRP
ncbi:flagellar hook-length control protein FliK [Variovorax sp. KK3]|uniref:flagellar hook-length control protein FliK n=1 Tax=Variovorax sp. KK3 TaxID=1855728 RepID=UPI00097C094E|nr:flagellar hook-length control protein FliK [Variovorax sp. KK3]